MDSLEMIARCAEVATRYHVFEAKDVRNEFRKDRVTPFIVHPARVAGLVGEMWNDPIAISAAWLHDVLEDCDVTRKQVWDELSECGVESGFAHNVLEIVEALTKPQDKDRYGKIDSTIEKIGKLPYYLKRDALVVKMADVTDNMSVLDGVDQVWLRRHYLPETLYLSWKLVSMWEEGGVGRYVPQMMIKIVKMRCEQYGVGCRETC
jgi:guanosine-3',5'-bis(diphosphate) 3'-pyrophosphohydrolase